jgi:hypothetical protein
MYYDMIYMDACNLIFDRPWQYDMDSILLGRINLCKIRKNDVNYNTLVLLKGEPNPKASKVKRKICFTVINSTLEM